MTERLYLEDPYLARFDAEVRDTRRAGERAAVVLTRTAFYPDGGGQPGDRGTLGGCRVVDVKEVDGEILHLLDGPAPAGAVVGVVDWARRFDHMQQHHGQHLLSAAFDAAHGARTVSFHLGEETCTIDLDAPPSRLDDAALADVERRANEVVWRDLPVVSRDFAPEELARLPLRKEPTKGSRVVVVEGVDASPCGGTHPRRTGEVGAIAVLRAAKWGAGTRVEFACGGRVLRLLRASGERLAEVASALRCPPGDAPAAAARLAADLSARRKELDALVGVVAVAEAERLAAGGMPAPERLASSGLPPSVRPERSEAESKGASLPPSVRPERSEAESKGASLPPSVRPERSEAESKGASAESCVVAELTPPVADAAGFLRAVAQALAARGRAALLGARRDGRAYLCFARPKGPGPDLGAVLREAAAALAGKGGGAPDLAQGSGTDVEKLGDVLASARGRISG